jgi:superoxide dismutase, Cu-Zn family
MNMNGKKLTIGMLGVFLVLGMNVFSQMDMGKMAPATVDRAICILYPTAGNNVSGTITFTQTDKGVKVVADLQGLSKGKHGFHIHEFGDCSSPDGTSAGGHYNPAGKTHGAPMDMSRHMGDMGNLEADDSGKAHLEYIDAVIKLNGPGSVLGRSIIVHKGEDDLKTQPTGNSGARVACGVIGVMK